LINEEILTLLNDAGKLVFPMSLWQCSPLIQEAEHGLTIGLPLIQMSIVGDTQGKDGVHYIVFKL
jgi:hypothetical protein